MASLSSEEVEFLRESNAIEGVTDDLSLQQAAFAWTYLKEQKKLTLTILLKTHKIISLNSNLYPNEKGYFREVPVWVGGREGANWITIRTQLKYWLEKMNDKTPMDWKRLHVDYERIHPFVDFNGRTGRIFLNWYRLKIGLPILIIKDAEKQAYYQWFK